MTASIAPDSAGIGRLDSAKAALPEPKEELAQDARDADAQGDRPSALSLRYVLMVLGLSVAWGVLMNQFGELPIYWIMGPYATAVCVLLVTLRGHALRRRLQPTLRNVALGVAFGVAMTLLTYPAFDLAKSLFPQLVSHVADLYRQSQNEKLGVALLWVVVILTAEEFLWRGAWYEAWCPRIGPVKAGALSVVTYALTQLCSGSFIVCLLALVCGTAWTALRYYSKSIVPSLIAHMIWTPTVILLVPVTWQ